MQEVYRIMVKPYGYDHWNIFTKDVDIFNSLKSLGNTDQAREAFGSDLWDELCDADYPKTPYVLLGEAVLHQRD